MAKKVFSTPKWACERWHCQFKAFTNKFSLQMTLLAAVIFQFCRQYQKLLSSLWNTHHLSKVKFQFHTIFESWERKEAQPPPPLSRPLNTLCILSIWQHSRINKRVIVPPYKTSMPAVDDISGEQFFNSHMNLHVCSRIFAFKLKWKILHLFVEKSELTKYLKINL